MGVLDGVRVIDFGQYIAGPLAAMMLADHGAEVIHVDPPGGPRWKTDADAFYNRGKQRISLALPDQAALAEDLIASADVVIENFRPGVFQHLGLAADAPELIYCSLPGFASDDPRRDVAAWEGVIGAATDLYTPYDQPVFTALPLASNFAAFHAATAIVMALIERERSGLGQRIEVPLFDAMFELIGANGVSLNGHYPVARTLRSRMFVCGDGRPILFNSTSTPRFERFARAAGVPDPPDFASRSAQDWEDAINAAGGPTTIVRTAREWIEHPHARARGTVVQLDDPELGPTWMPGINVHLSETPGEIRPRSVIPTRAAYGVRRLSRDPTLRSFLAPHQDDRTPSFLAPHQDDGTRSLPAIRRSAGLSQNDSSVLTGINVLDLTQVVAGPCTGRILVEYGADVIKINNPHPESLTTAVSLSMRPMDPGNQQHEHLNRGKQTVLLDLHSVSGRNVMHRLIDRADVLMQNFARGMAERYGIGYDQVRQRKPDLVYFSLSAYGYGGPMENYRGFEGNAQAATGLMDRFGGDGPPLGQPYLLDDYGTGIRGAFAIGLALYHRARTGRGQHVNISLVETATYHQAPYILDYAGKVWNTEPRGQDTLGWSPLQRLYRARDGWFFLGAADWSALASVEGLEDCADESALEQRFAHDAAAFWVARLRSAGVGAHVTTRVEDLMDDAWVREHRLSITQHIDGLGEMSMPGVAARLSRTPLRIGAPVHPVGADTSAVLESIGIQQEVSHV
jgi:crotonobetainyl-CoA:carnitine CoA-transferase CaiB-like acyl-CoA transferase